MSSPVSVLRLAVASALLVLALAAGGAAQGNDWTTPFPPFRIIGNVYWVGSHDLSTYLITTPQGHILVNTGIGDTARQIADSVAKLGFNLSDVKILTATHGHYDHVAGMADLKRMTGATLLVSARDKALLESGGKSDFLFGKVPAAQFPPVSVDRTFEDGAKIVLGGVELTAHIHPGHTQGATSFTMNVTAGGIGYRVLIANMPSINPGTDLTGMPGYPEIGEDYARTFRSLGAMNVDVWLASHASQFRLHEKYKPGDPYRPDRFVDPDGFKKSLAALERTYQEQLRKDRAARK